MKILYLEQVILEIYWKYQILDLLYKILITPKEVSIVSTLLQELNKFLFLLKKDFINEEEYITKYSKISKRLINNIK
jgi:hypothetical protein